MTWPTPQPGLVIRYSYLWHAEAAAGREEGVKDRPCAVLLSVQESEHATPRVLVLPITHVPPRGPRDGIEVPAATKMRLGLDTERSWIILSEVNEFRWPGPDLRPLPGQGPESVAFGFLPPRFFRQVREAFLASARARRTKQVSRSG